MQLIKCFLEYKDELNLILIYNKYSPIHLYVKYISSHKVSFPIEFVINKQKSEVSSKSNTGGVLNVAQTYTSQPSDFSKYKTGRHLLNLWSL